MMNVSGFWGIFGIGALGSLALEILRWYNLRESNNFPDYFKSPFYWIVTLSMIVLGGLLSCLYGIEGRNAVAVFQLGASTPALVATFATGTNNIPSERRVHRRGEEKAPNLNLRAFLSFRG